MRLMSLTAVELGKKIKAKEVTVTEAVTAALDAIEAKEKKVNSFVTVDREGALKRAEEVQKMIDDGTLTGPLAGVYDHLQRRRRQRQHGSRDRQGRDKLHPARLRLHRSRRSGVQGLGD